MKKLIHIAVILLLMLQTVSCSQELMETEVPDKHDILPEGVPVTLVLPFSGSDLLDVEVGTKAESSRVDESQIHDLYVMIFSNKSSDMEDTDGDGINDSHPKIYGRYFSYDHLKGSLTDLNTDKNECWFVDNKKLNGAVGSKTVGAVKVSTITCSDAKLVVIANVKNAVSNMDGGDALNRLKVVEYYEELQGIQVCLEQDVVNRKDLFLMTGELDVNTADMTWGTLPAAYNSDYTVHLTPVDAKVKFRVKVKPEYISAVTPVYWQVCNTPDRCYLYPSYDSGKAPTEISYFDSQQYYFEGKEEVDGATWYTFCFYMLENREPFNASASKYHQRELRSKIDSEESGYLGVTGSQSDGLGDHYVINGDWRYAPTFGTYVRFDLILTLTTAGIENIGGDDPEGMTIGHALTSDAIFTVHLGNFGSSGNADDSPGFNDYNTLRGHSYTYNVTINNTKSIYTEVMTDEEEQAGQEGFLLLTDSEIINADCHYEYHQLSFEYRPTMSQDKFSWYVKTPFGEGGPRISKSGSVYSYDASGLDYKWVKFGLNKLVPLDYNPATDPNPDPIPYYSDALDDMVRPYTNKRHKYPGDSHYDPDWHPSQGDLAEDQLMDITQLIEYIFAETAKQESTGSSDFIADNASDETVPVIRVTAFIDEFYYDKDPLDPDAPYDPELWRKFVNANPRELHILSDARSSRDRNSDVILSSHSVIQQSIQTIYNIYSTDLQSLWGTEHHDEMREKSNGWPYWPYALDPKGTGGRAGKFSDNSLDGKENGRLNSAYIWDLYSSQVSGGSEHTNREWETYINYEVTNNTPELLETYHGMAWSCLTRNRDNDGDGVIDRDEMRWYLAASNQLAGMWIGNESLSIHARLYQPAEGQWRAHIISSSDKRVSWTEEGGGATQYTKEFGASAETWPTIEQASLGESVRCLRNIGSYDAGGTLRDITGAPYDVEPQSYFTITEVPNPEDEADLHYIFHFDRLNPKSLRELTETDLPYHDQFHVNNCVYLKMETQSRRDEDSIEAGSFKLDVDGKPGDETYTILADHTYSVAIKDINPVVTKLGYNPFCPPGYRFPNHSEALLMSLYLPNEAYHLTNSSGGSYGKTVYSPTRTYYDRGYYGKNITGFEFDYRGAGVATEKEQKKAGWGWSDKLHCAQTGDKMTVSRCVRDVSMTGTIEGGILMKDELYPGDDVPLSFSFYSSGASFISASLKLCYTDGGGVYHERDIPVQTTPTGLQFLANQTVSIPTLDNMGLTDEILDNNDGELRHKTKFKITLRNAYTSKTFEQPFTLGNPLGGSFSVVGNNELPPNEDKNMNFNVTSLANNCRLAEVTLTLKYKNHLNADVEKNLTIPGDYLGSPSYVHLNEAISIPDLGELSLLLEDLPRPATLELTATDEGGSSMTYPIIIVNGKHLQLGSNPVFDGFRIRATAANTTVTFDANYAGDIQYSFDGGETWQDGTTPYTLVNVDDEICVKGNRTNYTNYAGADYDTPSSHPLFSTSSNKKVYIAGDIMSLLDDANTLEANAFHGTFSKGTTNLTYIDIDPADPLYLPVTTLASGCYKQMFRQCTSLTHAPTFTVNAAAFMCCYNMFRGCSSLSDISTISLPANQMYEGCYREMFRLCTSLTTVDPDLLPATDLAPHCYRQMFNGCSAITAAPDLPAATLTTSCYHGMFLNCSNLASVKCLARTGINSNDSTLEWLKGTKGSGTRTFVKYTGITWPTNNVNGIPSGWTVQEATE